MHKPVIFFFFTISFLTSHFGYTQVNTFSDTLSSFNAGVLTPTPDRSLMGVEFADGHFWITGSDPDDSYQHKLYKISTEGELVEYFEYGLEFAGWSDLAYDGDYLYVADIDTIRQIDLETGQKTGVKIKGPEYYLNGLAYDPASDHFWVSGDGNIIYEVDRDGNITNSISFVPDLPAGGLAWDTWTEGGPYLWVWSMKYTPDDVRPKAFQVNPATGLLTGLEFEGVVMHPNYPAGADYAMGATISEEVINGKISFIGLHGSSFVEQNDQLDWVVQYDLDPENTGMPGPLIDITPGFIENDLYPGDSAIIEVVIENLSDTYTLEWSAKLEYPNDDDQGQIGDSLLAFDASLLTIDTNKRMRSIAYIDNYIYVVSGLNSNKQFQLFQFDKTGTELIGTDTLYSAFNGWTAITSDDEYIYAAQQYMIQVFDPINKILVDTYGRPSFSPNALAYDPQKELFYLGNGNGAIMTTNKEGDEVNFYIVPYEIEGMAWDNTSPGGPYLWVYYQSENTLPKAIRLNPESGANTGQGFDGLSLSPYQDDIDEAEGIVVTADWQESKLVMLALHNTTDSIDEGQDKVVVYDLNVIPPPGWIDFIGSGYGTVEPLRSDSLTVRLDAIMEDTLMIAQLVVSSNDVLNPAVVVPVNFLMLPAITTNVSDNEDVEPLKVKLYPNPATNTLKIKLNENSLINRISIFNIQGRLVKTIDLNDSSNHINLDLTGWLPGLYTMMIYNKEIVERIKFIKN